MSAVVGKIKCTNGVAGQIAYAVDVTYPGEPTSRVEFIGSVHGGPVVMVTATNLGGTFVRDADRFGPFGPQWVRNFFA